MGDPRFARLTVSAVRELPFPSPPLADSVVALRPWRETDVPAIVRAYGDPVVERFSWPSSSPYTEADARVFVSAQERGRRDGRQVELALVERSDPEVLLGSCSLHAVEPAEGRGSVGYWLIPEARGRGLATRAVRLVARWAFGDLGLARIQLSCAPDNHASQRVAERCGFTREGLLRGHMPFKGGRRDTVVFGLLPGELR